MKGGFLIIHLFLIFKGEGFVGFQGGIRAVLPGGAPVVFRGEAFRGRRHVGESAKKRPIQLPRPPSIRPSPHGIGFSLTRPHFWEPEPLDPRCRACQLPLAPQLA